MPVGDQGVELIDVGGCERAVGGADSGGELTPDASSDSGEEFGDFLCVPGGWAEFGGFVGGDGVEGVGVGA